MTDPRLSIIIPTFNEEDSLDLLLQTAKEHSGKLVREIIIADGGSTDGTLAVAERNNVKIKLCTRKGRAAQMNQGAKEANGNVLYFLHADTLPPNKFDRQIAHTIRSGIHCGCFQLSFDDPHPLLRFYAWFTRFSTTLVRFGDQSLFVTKNLFEKIGGFDDSLTVMEDQLIVRSLKKVSKFKVLDDRVITSARRYKQNGVIRLQLIFGLIMLMYYLGASQNTLRHVYTTFIDQN